MSQPTIRKQRIRRSSVKVRLIVFGTLAVLLILFSAGTAAFLYFQNSLLHTIPICRI